ncbi:MAG: hypothetical protein SXV54_17080 [Chloroflexota bacterium]|nr:hypothetical protein [Chloroflexota bacterium]
MRKRVLAIAVITLVLSALACGPTPTPTLEVFETAVAQTTEAQLASVEPTNKPPPTAMHTPTPPQPTSTHTPAPADTPTARPTPTPALCAIAIAPGLAPRLDAHPEILLALGCPVIARQQTWAAEARFQKGRMSWQQDTGMIHILYDAGSFQVEPDQYAEGDPEDACPEVGDAPEGLFKPVRGFNWHWCHTAGVRAGLGWALADEIGYDAVWQDFEHGHVLQSRGNHIFAFYGDGTWDYIE